MSTATAGRGDPYWYEWFVGLREVIGMIDEGSEITSVAFQLEGVKGWDDVVVKLADGSRRCYQVKYTLDAASFADCQNFSAAELRRPFRATMPTENGFGSGVRCKNFTRFPKL